MTPKDKVVEETTTAQEIVDAMPAASEEQLPPPPVEPEYVLPKRVKKSVMIDGKEYFLDSANTALLKKLDGGKRKNDKGVWEEVQYDYLPIGAIYQLMDGLFDQYDFYSEPMVYANEEYVVNKKVFNNQTKQWEDGQDTVRTYEKKVRIIVTTIDENYGSTIREVIGYAQGVASIKQLTSDPSRNGFAQKMAARARKEALKNLGRVFRVTDDEGDDAVVINEEVESASKNTAAVPPKAPAKTVDNIVSEMAVEEAYNKIVAMLKPTNENLFDDEGIFHMANLTGVLMMTKKELGAKKGSPELLAIEKLYNELVVKAQDYKKE